MIKHIPLILVLINSIHLVSGGLQTYGNLTAKYGTDILSFHNSYRNAEGKSLKNMTWDAAIAKTAQNWANACGFSHSGPGENLAASSIYKLPGGNRPATDAEMQTALKQAVDQWMGEKPSYRYTNNTCSEGKVCGHYTQVVWAGSIKLGCGIAQCDNILSGYSSYYTVCQYSPAGNYIGQKPY